MERGFKVHAINPKQMDRFRDRFTLAGAKDDSRDAEVMASALRTDARCFRLLAVADPVVVELREWSRIAEDLGAERNRLTNRYARAALALLSGVPRARKRSRGGMVARSVGDRADTRQSRAYPRDDDRQGFSSATASVASMPPTCSAFCASRPSRLPPERQKPPAPMSRR